MRHLAFLIGERLMAVPVPQTEGIIAVVPIRPTPGLRPAFRGLIHWHDRIVPVVGILPPIAANQLILLATRRGPLAIEATEILGIHPDNAIEHQEPAPPDSPPYHAGEAILRKKSHALLDAEGVAEWAFSS
jgi:chemotaxis signal transduction protein